MIHIVLYEWYGARLIIDILDGVEQWFVMVIPHMQCILVPAALTIWYNCLLFTSCIVSQHILIFPHWSLGALKPGSIRLHEFMNMTKARPLWFSLQNCINSEPKMDCSIRVALYSHQLLCYKQYHCSEMMCGSWTYNEWSLTCYLQIQYVDIYSKYGLSGPLSLWQYPLICYHSYLWLF